MYLWKQGTDHCACVRQYCWVGGPLNGDPLNGDLRESGESYFLCVRNHNSPPHIYVCETELISRVLLNFQVSAVQVFPTELMVEFHPSGAMHPVKTNLHIKGIYTTDVRVCKLANSHLHSQ